MIKKQFSFLWSDYNAMSKFFNVIKVLEKVKLKKAKNNLLLNKNLKISIQEFAYINLKCMRSSESQSSIKNSNHPFTSFLTQFNRRPIRILSKLQLLPISI